MLAVAVFPDPKQVRLLDVPEPRRETDHDVELRMLEVGVCGTDREIARFEYGAPPPGERHLVIGHESLAEVVAIGRAVTRVAPGDLVVTTVRRPCASPACAACRMGRQDFCQTGGFSERGIVGRHGFMAERVVDHEDTMHVVPAALRDVGVLVEPLTIAEKALAELVQVQARLPWGRGDGGRPLAGQRAVVLGAGPVGLLAVLALRLRGADAWVYSLEPTDGRKARWVESIGARYRSASDTTPAELAAAVGPVDLMFEASGAARLAFDGMGHLARNGTFIFTGVPGRRAPLDLDGAALMRGLVLGNQLVYGTVNAGPDAFDAAIADLGEIERRWPDPLRRLITGRRAPADMAAVLARGRDDAGEPSAMDATIKEIVAFDDDPAGR